jgi:peptide chain release factor 3
MEPLDYSIARWVGGGWDAVNRADEAGKLHGVFMCQDRWERPVLLFRNPWKVTQLENEEEYLRLEPWALPP